MEDDNLKIKKKFRDKNLSTKNQRKNKKQVKKDKP
jgi:hypothetical protein